MCFRQIKFAFRCTSNLIVSVSTLFSPILKKEQGLFPSKNYELTVSQFRERTREKLGLFLRGIPIGGQREGQTHFLSPTAVS